MFENKTLQACLAFAFPANGFDQESLREAFAGPQETECPRCVPVGDGALHFEDFDFARLTSAVDAGEKVLSRLLNGNWVVPVGFRYDEGAVSAIELYDPLATASVIAVPRDKFVAQWTGEGVVMKAAAGKERKGGSGIHGVVGLPRLLLEYRGLLAPILFTGFLVSLLSLTSPFFFMLVLDKVVSYGAWSTLTALVVGAIALIAFESVFEYLRGRFLSRMTHSVGSDANLVIFHHTTTVPAELHEARPVGAWINDNRQAARFVGLLRQLSVSFVEYVFAFLFFAVLLWLSWQLTAVALLTCMLQIGIAFLHGRYSDETGRGVVDGAEQKESILIETLSHLRTLRILGLLGLRTEDYQRSVAAAERVREEKEGKDALVRALSAFMERAGMVVMLAVGVGMVVQSSLTVGALVACNILMRRLTGPLARLPALLRDLRELTNIQRRWQDTMRTKNSAASASEPKLKKTLVGSVSFKKVYFRYARDARFQMMIDVEFPLGKTVAVVGNSGAGKTTLLNLLLGVHSPQVGLVCIDGSDLRELDLEHMRRQIGVVSHDIGLFRGSVRSNIASWDRTISLERIQAAARLACVHDAIQAFPKGYEELIGDDGANLSSGQKSRISLARALVRDPALLLLDELTGDLDPATERGLVSNIMANRRGRTTIFFTHRAMVAAQADVVFYLDDGRIVASGQHDRLVAENASYREHWGGQGA